MSYVLVICHPSYVFCRLSLVCLPFVTCCPLIGNLSSLICNFSFFIYHLFWFWYVIFHLSVVVCHLSSVISHMLSVIFHLASGIWLQFSFNNALPELSKGVWGICGFSWTPEDGSIKTEVLLDLLKKHCKARVSIRGQRLLLQISLRIKMFRF